MSGWSFAWSAGETEEAEPSGGARVAAWAVYAAVGLAGLWTTLYLGGLFTTLGTAQGSERHGANAVRVAEDGSFGVPAMYLAEGQTAWWDYDVEVEGKGGIRLIVGKAVPTRDFIVRVETVRASGRGRFAVVAPASGVYSFDYELEPVGGLFGRSEPGATRYRLKWGVD